MPTDEQKAGTNHIAGNANFEPAAADAKMGADSVNTNANSSLQPATPAMQPDSATDTPPSSKELFDTEQSVGKGAVEPGGQQENREANPADVVAPAPPTDSKEPNVYGGNFGNDVQGSYHDPNRAHNQQSDANRGAFGEQGTLGATHGGYGNQYREFDTAAERPAAEATEEKYYGQGASQPGLQHNSYRDYDGRDLAPSDQSHAVRDTPPAGQLTAAANASAAPSSPQDNRNLPGRSGEAAAFQTDNGSPTTGGGYAADYGHTSGVGLPANTPDNYQPTTPGSQNTEPGQPSPRGGYDGTPTPAASAPAAVDAPGNPQTGDSRNGFGPGGSKEGNTSQGHGSKGGSYDDQNPGARGPEYDNFTQQDKAQNYGQAQRDDFRPADDKPADGDYGAAPRRNAGRDEE